MGEIDINKTNLLVSAISSLATFLTMFFVLLTLFEMAKQRKSTYRPDIVVLPSQYFVYSKATHDRIQSMYISDKELSDNTSSHKPLDHITLEGFNIGLGTAKFVHVTWEYNVSDLIHRLKNENEGFKVETPSDREVKLEIIADRVGLTINTNYDSKYAYILPVSVKSDATSIPIPFVYLAITSASLCLQWVGAEDWAENPNFPVFKMKISYRDIGNNKHRKSFNIQPTLLYGSTSGRNEKDEEQSFQARITFKIDEDK